MGPDKVIDVLQTALQVTMELAAPMLLCGLLVGLITNILQAVTQINESTLSLVPKLIAMALALILFAPWMIQVYTAFALHILSSIPQQVR